MKGWHLVKVVLGTVLCIISPALPFLFLGVLIALLGCFNGLTLTYHCQFLIFDLNQDVQGQVGDLSWWLYFTVPAGVIFLVFSLIRWLWHWISTWR